MPKWLCKEAIIKATAYRTFSYGITLLIFLLFFQTIPFIKVGFAVICIEITKFFGYYLFEIQWNSLKNRILNKGKN